MITYTISPNNSPVYTNAPRGKKGQKMILPAIKQHLFFATSDEYINIQKNSTYANKPELFTLETLPSHPTLIRANSVVEYECGINLKDSREIDDFLDMLDIKAKCPPKQQYDYNPAIREYIPSFLSEYHLEHNYDRAILDDKQKKVLTDHSFPDNITIDKKNFVLHAIGANLCKQKIDSSSPTDTNTKGRHMQIIYIKREENDENGGYLKFKRPEPVPSIKVTPTVSEISQYPEHDAICVNIHFSIQANLGPTHFSIQANLNFDEQFHNIGKDFNYITNPLVTQKGAPQVSSRYPVQRIDNYYNVLRTQFADSVKFAMRNDFNNCNHLYGETLQGFKDCAIKVGKVFLHKIEYLGKGKINTKTGYFNVKFSGGVEKDFFDLKILQDKLVAPVDLNNILLRTNTFDEETNESDDQDITTQSNEEEVITDQSVTSALPQVPAAFDAINHPEGVAPNENENENHDEGIDQIDIADRFSELGVNEPNDPPVVDVLGGDANNAAPIEVPS